MPSAKKYRQVFVHIGNTINFVDTFWIPPILWTSFELHEFYGHTVLLTVQ